MKYKILAICFLSFFVLSCSDEKAILPIQSNANAGRTNSYEHIEYFNNAQHHTNKVYSKDSSGVIQLPIAMPDNCYYVATNNFGISYIDGSELKWRVFPDTNYAVCSAMAVDKDANLYLLLNNGDLYSYTKSGKLKLKILTRDTVSQYETFSDLLLQDDGIVVASNTGLLKKIGFDGKDIWSRKDIYNIPKTFCSDDENNLYITLTSYNETGDTIVSISSKGEIRWKKDISNMQGMKNIVYSNNKIYASFYKNTNYGKLSELFCLDKSGKILWSKQLPVPILNISVDKKENVYVSGYNTGTGEGISGIYCISQGGSIKWSTYLKSAINAPMLLSNTDLAISAMSKEGAGTFIFDREIGKLKRHVSLTDAPILYLNPVVSSEGNLVYFGSDKLKITTIISSRVY